MLLSLSPTLHYSDVIMSTMSSQITSLTSVYSIVSSRRRSKKTWKLRVTGLCGGNSTMTGEFPTQSDSKAEKVSIWWCYHGKLTNTMFLPLSSTLESSVTDTTLNAGIFAIGVTVGWAAETYTPYNVRVGSYWALWEQRKDGRSRESCTFCNFVGFLLFICPVFLGTLLLT